MTGFLVTPASSSTKIYSPIFVKSRIPHFSGKSSHCLSLPLNAGFKKRGWFPSTLRASVGTQEYVVEPSTNVKFPMSLAVPGSNNSLTLFGTGYREKVFAIIGVKVYAAGLYSDRNIVGELAAWKGKPATQIQEDGGFFTSVLQSSMEKAIQIVLVRDVDGKTFWDALNDAISPRIKNPTPVDELALSKLRETFQERPLKQGNVILLTWTQPSKMLVSISSDGVHFNVDATIDSSNVSSSLFYVYFGESPVSPSLKESVASGLASSI